MSPEASTAPGECDLLVVGGGIIGLAVAREALRRRPGGSVAVLERESAVGRHQTGHNSGVIHAGIYYEPGSLKARLCTAGARALYELCERSSIPARRVGKLVIATSDDEVPALRELHRRALANGVPDVAWVEAGRLGEIEPHAAGVAAVHSPHTGVVDFGAVARALAREVIAAGGEVVTGCAVQGTHELSDRVSVRHSEGETRARAVVVCAGGWSDRLARQAGAPADPRIVPFRGGYLRLRAERRHLVRGLIYPVPDPRLPFLGIHLTRHVDDDVTIGPTALLVGARDAYRLTRVRARDLAETLAWPGTLRLMARWWSTGLAEIARAASRRAFVRSVTRYVPELTVADVREGPSGIRAQAVGRDGRLIDDFVFARTGRTLHVRNAPSPAATASLAIAEHILDQLDG